jgi:glycosyltransferase involved in cell wall biosynthesis
LATKATANALIIPVFNDRASCVVLLGQIAALFNAQDWRICLIDDGSTTDPPRLSDLTDSGLTGVILRLPHNMGHQPAIACGVGYVAANWPGTNAVIMDADGEDRPEAVSALLSHLDPTELCAIVAKRRRRTESLAFRFFYAVYKTLFRLLTGHRIDFGNFMALSGPAVHRLASMHQTWLHVPAALIASRIPRKNVPTDRGKRYAGKSGMNIVSLSVHGMRALMVFADAVLMRLIFGGIALIVVAIVIALIALGLKVTGNATPGWFTTVVGLRVVMVMQTLEIFAVLLILTSMARGGILRDASKAYQDCIASLEATP